MDKETPCKISPETRQSISTSTMNSTKVLIKNDDKKYRVFDGMIKDIRKRYSHYASDYSDALNFQCITSVVFMFIASFAPAITFGGLMGSYTEYSMGTIETLIAQCLCGIIWGLFAAQPLVIMSPTGPVLIFEASLYTICQYLGYDFLSIRFFAGIWIFVISIIVVALDGSRLLKYVTKFTEDIFTCLISAIFISESMKFLIHTWIENPVKGYDYYVQHHLENCTNHSIRKHIPCHEPNTALITWIALFGTFILAILLKKLRDSIYFGRHLRRMMGDFGVLIAIIVVKIIVNLVTPNLAIQRLEMPDHLNYTDYAKRGHGLIVIPYHTTLDRSLISLAAAMLVFILLFVETEITELLLSRKERCLKKGSGMHFDLLLMGLCSLICSIFGLPWMCGAAVQSLAHCSSLTVMKKNAPGAKPEISKVIEQRVTTLGVSILIGLMALFGSYLRLPIATLFGVFLYLGVMNLYGVQLVQRFILFFVPKKYFPTTSYTESVSLWKMHGYTSIQVIFLIGIYLVKHFKESALSFPFVLLMFILFRQMVLPKLYTEKEIKALECEDDQDDWMDKDHYENARIPV